MGRGLHTILHWEGQRAEVSDQGPVETSKVYLVLPLGSWPGKPHWKETTFPHKVRGRGALQVQLGASLALNTCRRQKGGSKSQNKQCWQGVAQLWHCVAGVSLPERPGGLLRVGGRGSRRAAAALRVWHCGSLESYLCRGPLERTRCKHLGLRWSSGGDGTRRPLRGRVAGARRGGTDSRRAWRDTEVGGGGRPSRC